MEAFGAVTTREDFMEYPEDSARPFDPERAGTVISDGGAAMILASETFWKSQSEQDLNEVYCEISGFGQTCDAHHVLRPTDEGIGMKTAIYQALEQAGIDIEKGGDENYIDMFNCHATSTPKGDASEANCIKEILSKAKRIEGQESNPKYTVISANKGNIGHMVAGAAMTESIFAMQSFKTG